MGAHIQVDGKVAVIEGVPQLTGAPVNACDLRAGAAMVIAGLAAQCITEVGDIHHIERGYEDLVGKLSGVQAKKAGAGAGQSSRTCAPAFYYSFSPPGTWRPRRGR